MSLLLAAGGTAPADTPEAYRRLVAGRLEQPAALAATLVAGILAPAVAVALPQGRLLIAPQEVQQRQAVLRAPQPVETPRATRLIASRQEQAHPPSVLRSGPLGEVAPAIAPRPAWAIVGPQAPQQSPSWLGGPPLPAAPVQPAGRLLVPPQAAGQPPAWLGRAPLEQIVLPPAGRLLSAPQEPPSAQAVLRSGPLVEAAVGLLPAGRAIQGPQAERLPQAFLRPSLPVETPVAPPVGRTIQGPQAESPQQALLRPGVPPPPLVPPPPARGVVVAPQIPQQPASLTAAGPIEAQAAPTQGASGAQVVEGRQKALQIVRSWLWPAANLPEAEAPRGQQVVVPSQREAGRELLAWTWRGSLPPEPAITPGASGAEIVEGHQRWLVAAAQARPWLLPSIAIPPAAPETPGASGALFMVGRQAALLHATPAWLWGATLEEPPTLFPRPEGASWPVRYHYPRLRKKIEERLPKAVAQPVGPSAIDAVLAKLVEEAPSAIEYELLRLVTAKRLRQIWDALLEEEDEAILLLL